MKKYSVEWKMKTKRWIQSEMDSYGWTVYRIHYIRYGCEYAAPGKYWSWREAKEGLRNDPPTTD